MKNKRMITVLLCSILIFGGCGTQEAEKSGQKSPSVVEENQIAKENAVKAPEMAAEETAETIVAGASDGSIVVKMDKEKWVSEEGSLICTLHDFRLYDTAEDASVEEDAMMTIDASDYMDRSKFLTMQIDIQNIDFPGDYEDGSFNVSMFTIEPKEERESGEWFDSYPVYVSEPGRGETDYYHVLVKQGGTKTITIGFYIPVQDADELRSQCQLSVGGSYYEIPQIQ